MTAEQANAALADIRGQIAVLTMALAEQHRHADLAALGTLLASAAQSCQDRLARLPARCPRATYYADTEG